MIIPMVCFSCGKPIAHLWLPYQALVEQYGKDPKKSLEEFITKHPHIPKGIDVGPEFMALADLHIGRACCRRMFLSQHDMYQKVR
jgi:DNA-directed RNA polymerase I, II, and III subunit RPABC5/DNA-directed RNA polymerase subunit N